MDILAHALRELNSSRLPAFCAKFKVSFSAGSANDTGDDSRLDDSRRGPCVVIEHVMEEKVSHPFKDPLSAVGDCLFRSSARKKSDSRTNSLVLSTARRLCRRGLAASPYAEGHLAAQASPLKGFPDKANFDKRTDAQHGEPLHLDPAGTSGSCEESVGNRESLCSHRNYVLHSQAAFETYWKGNLHNIHEVLKELTESGTSELGWKRQGKLHEFTKAVTDVWQRMGEQVSTNTREVLSHLEHRGASSQPDFLAHELLPLLLRMREVWWMTQRHVAGNFLALYQKHDGASEQWLMSLREVDVHLLRTAILHREIMECELQKVLRTADRELTSTCFCLHDIFVKEGIGYWLAEHLDLIWSEFGNQVQKGVVNLHKAFDSPYVRAWASTVDTNTDEVALNIHSLWMAFIGRVQESRRHVVEEETTLQDDMDNSFLPQRIYTYTRILRRYEELANHDWQVTYRSTIAVLDQALSGGAVRGLGASCLSVVPVAHTKVMVIVTKIWEEVMVEIRQAFKECREKFEEAILVDHGL
ncbi:uncharacterized protein LOC142804276 isoform X1 [Rhipicephalus microplus]|uniref:uncharacterized protein LOC142804276 isoform X1 n=1 Tax=Rhipicephalus microplus TaxID=6941 RepID=UPI003F6C4D03